MCKSLCCVCVGICLCESHYTKDTVKIPKDVTVIMYKTVFLFIHFGFT